MRRLLLRFIQFLLVLVLAGLLWSGWYAYSRGFTKKWRLLLINEFHKRGVEVYVRRVTLDPFQGLVAREVEIRDANDASKVIALIDSVVLDINYFNLLHREPFLNAIDLHNADLWLPLDPDDPKSARVEISQLNARLVLPPHEWYLSAADALISGIRVSARGRFFNPEALTSGQTNGNRAEQQRTILRVFDELRALRFESAPPSVEVEFGGDLAEPDSVFAEATFWGETIVRGNYRIENAFASASYRNRVLDLKRCVISDDRGALEASGSFDTAAKHASARVRSTLDPQALAHAVEAPRVFDVLDHANFYSTPLVEISGDADFSGDAPSWKMLGRVSLQQFALRSVVFDSASAEVSFNSENGSRWYLRNAQLRDHTGELLINAMQLPNDFRATIESTINPNSLRPLFSGKALEELAQWDFQQSPKISLTITGAAPDPARCEARGEITLGHTRRRGVPMNGASSRFSMRGKTLTYENFRIDRDEGFASGAFAYDFERHEARLTNVQTKLNTTEAAVWIDPELAQHLAPYRFKIAPNLTINGVVNVARGNETRLEVLVDAPSGMDYVFCKRTLAFPKVSGRLFFAERRLRLSDVAASLYGGRLRASADISLARETPGYTARIEADDVDFSSITKLYFDYEKSGGAMSGVFDFRGKNDDARTLQGHGEVAVTEGNVFAIPVLGPFSGILNGIVPGMGYNIAHKGGCTFDVRDSVISTRDFLVKGQGFNMIGEGRIFFLDDKIDFNIRLNAQGLPGVLLFPVSKLFEYASDGSLSKPVWKPKRLPSL